MGELRIVYEKNNISEDYMKFNAGSKAREDIYTIAERMGFTPLSVLLPAPPKRHNDWDTLKRWYRTDKVLKKALLSRKKGDFVLLQFPMLHFSCELFRGIRKAERRGIHVILLVHDLESLRYHLTENEKNLFQRLGDRAEKKCLLAAGSVIVHNEAMAGALMKTYGTPKERLHSLELFDYITDAATGYEKNGDEVAIAGNLDPEKSAYLLKLPGNVRFRLFGKGYVPDAEQKNITYLGTVLPAQLPEKLLASFGLVWDGPSAKSCEGPFGEYLQYNNPHKTSLYLAAGVPVIAWEKAAIAEFIKKNGCGFTISSLSEIAPMLSSLTAEEKEEMAKNAQRVGNQLRQGYFTQKVILEIRKQWEEK